MSDIDLQEAYNAGYRQRDAEIVVRCNDCYYFGEPTRIKGYHVCVYNRKHIQEQDYCSKGLRYIKCDADK